MDNKKLQEELKAELDNIFGESEENAELASNLSEIDPGTAAMAAGGVVAGGGLVASRIMARRKCRKKYPDMKSQDFKACFKNQLTLGQKKTLKDQDDSILKTYAVFYVSENDEFDTKKKLDMLNFIENADESMMEDLFENGEIPLPHGLFEDEGEGDEILVAIRMLEQAAELMLSEESASVTAGKEMIKTAKDYWKPRAHKFAMKAGEKIEKAAQHMPGGAEGMMGVSAAVAAAAALTAGVMAYRKHFSKAAKACKGAPDKAACMSKFKQQAVAAKISAMNAGKAKCAKSKDPAACKAKIDAKIKAAKG